MSALVGMEGGREVSVGGEEDLYVEFGR